MSKRINLGLLGASHIARRVYPSIRSVTEIQNVYVAAGRANSADQFASEFENIRAFASYKECLEEESIDAVYISVLNSDHVQLIRQSLLAGKHVLCEKPLVLSSEDAKAMFELAESKGLILMEGLMYRHQPELRSMVKTARNGELGEILHLNLQMSFPLYSFDESKRRARAQSDKGGGALFDLGCYAVDFVNWVLQPKETPKVLAAVSRFDSFDGKFDRATFATLRSENILISLACAVDQVSANHWEIIGSKKAAWTSRSDSVVLKKNILNFSDLKVPDSIEFNEVDSFGLEFQNFARTVLGLEKAEVLPLQSVQNAELLERIARTAGRS